jgi:uncharacterized delta-60 repeat protein
MSRRSAGASIRVEVRVTKQLSRVLASVLVLLLTGFVVFAVGSAEATSGTLAPGHLDPSFGKGGQVITGLGAPSGARAVVIQRDGKIVAAGTDYTLVRYKRNGSLDLTFGSKGKVKTSFEPSPLALAWALALQRDGKIIAVGTAESSQAAYFALARYKSDGSLDRSFGSGGRVKTAFAGRQSAANAWAVAVQPDGKILVGGDVAYLDESGKDQLAIALARYRPDGSLDPSFGVDGKVTTPTGAWPSRPLTGLALQRDGKIVVSGASKNGPQTLFALVRYSRNGVLDGSFGSGGSVKTAFGSLDGASDVLVQRSGKIVVVGGGQRLGHSVFALARYMPNGSLDPSFGSGGKVTTAFGSGGEAAPTAAALLPDGKIVLVGWMSKYPNWAFALARYRVDGRLDASFSVDGKVTTSFRKLARTPDNRLHQDAAWAVAIQRDGKIVAAGEGALIPEGSRQARPYKFELARYIGAAGKDTR